MKAGFERCDIVVIGAGPAGLSCAIEAKDAGLSAIILEKGSLVDAIRRFPTDLVWFSTAELLEIGSVPFSISTVRPTREDTLNYYRRVASHYQLDVRSFDQVLTVSRRTADFEILTKSGKTYLAPNVVVATGYFDSPNRLDVSGESLPNVFHYYREPFEFYGRDVVVIGGRNSAVEAALDLYRHGARVTLIHRGSKLSEGVKYWILPDIENRIAAGQVQGMFDATVIGFETDGVSVLRPTGVRIVRMDFAFVLVGFRPDVDHLRSWGVEIHPETLAPAHNPDTYETNVPGLYVAGSIVAGKNTNTVFVENGRLHGKKIIPAILDQRGPGSVDSEKKFR